MDNITPKTKIKYCTFNRKIKISRAFKKTASTMRSSSSTSRTGALPLDLLGLSQNPDVESKQIRKDGVERQFLFGSLKETTE